MFSEKDFERLWFLYKSSKITLAVSQSKFKTN